MSAVNERDQPGLRTQILLVEDHPLVRSGFELLISGQQDMEICGEADGQSQAIRLVREKRPDLAMIDLVLREGSGLDLCKHLASIQPGLRMLVVSAHDEELYADRALRAGAHGFISKGEAADRLIEAIRTVQSGGVWLSERMTERMLARVRQGSAVAQSPIERLSDRELEVFELIGRGRTTHEIAARLHLSPKTIESYRESLKTKLSLRNSTQLTHHAVQWLLESNNSSAD